MSLEGTLGGDHSEDILKKLPLQKKLYTLGMSSRGVLYRDVLQDVLGVSPKV
jgi:hypothetical protein